MASHTPHESSMFEDFDPVGLCRACQHGRVVNSARGSTFYLCRRSESDPRYAKYPRLPVLRCPGFEPDPRDEQK